MATKLSMTSDDNDMAEEIEITIKKDWSADGVCLYSCGNVKKKRTLVSYLRT